MHFSVITHLIVLLRFLLDEHLLLAGGPGGQREQQVEPHGGQAGQVLCLIQAGARETLEGESIYKAKVHIA